MELMSSYDPCVQSLRKEVSRLKRENKHLTDIVNHYQQDIVRFDYLLNLPVVKAQAIFWNFSNKKDSLAEIDKLMLKEGY